MIKKWGYQVNTNKERLAVYGKNWKLRKWTSSNVSWELVENYLLLLYSSYSNKRRKTKKIEFTLIKNYIFKKNIYIISWIWWQISKADKLISGFNSSRVVVAERIPIHKAENSEDFKKKRIQRKDDIGAHTWSPIAFFFLLKRDNRNYKR